MRIFAVIGFIGCIFAIAIYADSSDSRTHPSDPILAKKEERFFSKIPSLEMKMEKPEDIMKEPLFDDRKRRDAMDGTTMMRIFSGTTNLEASAK